MGHSYRRGREVREHEPIHGHSRRIHVQDETQHTRGVPSSEQVEGAGHQCACQADAGVGVVNKYGAKKTEIDGITFHSQAEARYYTQLKVLKRSKQIIDFTLQPSFVLLDKFKDNTGKVQQAITYKADFLIDHNDGTKEVVDVKGMVTQQYTLRKKMFLHRYPDYKFSEVKA